MTDSEVKAKKWLKANRFVAFFDIMGFKEMVERNSHDEVIKKLLCLKDVLNKLELIHKNDSFKNDYQIAETKSITFSDSIVIFSKGGLAEDANKIIIDAFWLLNSAMENGIAIKGAISYGEVTVDFENSLFFGRPIIDAYLLHDQLQMYSVIFDHHSEVRINSLKLAEEVNSLITSYKTNCKTGRITHKILRSQYDEQISQELTTVRKLYESVSGGPRIYVDNTIEFLNVLLDRHDRPRGKNLAQ